MTNVNGVPQLGAEAVKVNFGRASAFAAILTLVLLGLFVTGFVYAAVQATDTATAAIGSVFAALFSIPLLMVSVGLRSFFQPRGLAFDTQGVHYWHGNTWGLLPWQEIAAVGIGYEQPPKTPSVPTSVEGAVSDFVADKVKDAIKLDDKRKVALEIYPTNPQSGKHHPGLIRYWREYPAPIPGLAPARWRLPLPPVVVVAHGVSKGVKTFQPHLWIGWFTRPWTGGLFGAGGKR